MHKFIKKYSSLIVTIFYLGKFPYAPGTIGSIFSFFLIIILYQFINYLIFILIFFILLFLAYNFIKFYITDLDQKDAKEIIIDEFLGCYLIIIFFPIFKDINIYYITLIGFILFRIYDIIKIYPANIIDKKFKDSFGIIVDDLIAGIYSIITLFIIFKYVI